MTLRVVGDVDPYEEMNDCRRGGNLPPEKRTINCRGNHRVRKNEQHRTKWEDNILLYGMTYILALLVGDGALRTPDLKFRSKDP